jgi:hypothetical protein
MNRTSLVTRGIVAFALFAIENAASAQTFPGSAWIFPVPSALQWTPAYSSTASPLRTYSYASASAFHLGAYGESSRLDWLPANQLKGACRRRTAARGVELQRSGL